MKGSKQSTATAALPSHVPPQGWEKDRNSFSLICSTLRAPSKLILHHAQRPGEPALRPREPCHSPDLQGPRLSRPWDGDGSPLRPFQQTLPTARGLPKAGGLLLPLECVNCYTHRHNHIAVVGPQSNPEGLGQAGPAWTPPLPNSHSSHSPEVAPFLQTLPYPALIQQDAACSGPPWW